jgi:ketosteroid isomerase-like protein
MPPDAKSSSRSPALVPGAGLLALALVASIWAATFFGAEARVRRATTRVVALAEKSGAESPVALGLAAQRLGQYLATNAVLELKDYGALATGRQEIVSLFAQIRASLALVAFAHPTVVAAKVGPRRVNAHVAARYRLTSDSGEEAAGDGQADLLWAKGKDGWQIVRAQLYPDEQDALSGGWK